VHKDASRSQINTFNLLSSMNWPHDNSTKQTFPDSFVKFC
jgi:hypothetical protein